METRPEVVRQACSQAHRRRDAEELERVRQLGSVVVHDLNNAIFALLGRVQLLKRQVTDPQISKSVADILETVRLLESLVGSLHSACQREEAPFSVLQARQAVETALVEALRATEAPHGAAGDDGHDGVARAIAAIPTGTTFEGSATELAHALRQLVHLHRRRTARPLHISASFDADGASPRVRLSISDDGGAWPHPCTPPSILNGSCHLETLPLAAAQRALRDMGGKAALEPIAGGLRSTIELPIALDATPSPLEEAATCTQRAARGCEASCEENCQSSRRPRHILVADDDPAVRAILVAALESVGDEIDTIADPSALLEHPELELFDVVILDAGGGGLEALRRLRARGSALPVLVASGEALDERAIADGHAATRVMMKPIALDHLDHALSALTARRA
ncbi:MAG: response regulator [Phycisphaera sp.]|nr:response regulator [Phycisphaera sp.]